MKKLLVVITRHSTFLFLTQDGCTPEVINSYSDTTWKEVSNILMDVHVYQFNHKSEGHIPFFINDLREQN